MLINQNVTQIAEKRIDCCYLAETFIRRRKNDDDNAVHKLGLM